MADFGNQQCFLENHRQQFAALAHKTYFNYGGQGPLPQVAQAAINQAYATMQAQGPFSGQVLTWITQETAATRQAIAAELDVDPTTITLTEAVSVGCNIALWGLDWQPGDHLLLSDCEHPGIIAAAHQLSRRFGVEVSVCPLRATLNQGNPVAVVAAHLQPRTRLVVLSHVLWNTGQVLPLAEIVATCHNYPAAAQPVLVLVDAAQSVGVLPLDLQALAVDFYAFTGHKWWCGPDGVGGLYVRPEVQAQLQPTFIGWRGIEMGTSGEPVGWKPDGRRYEIATSAFPLCAGLRAALALHQQWGTPEARYQRICHLSQRLWQQLQHLPNVECLRSAAPEAGLVSFQLSNRQHQALVQQLEAQGILLRTISNPSCVRACVHYLTLESEVDRLVQVLSEVGDR